MLTQWRNLKRLLSTTASQPLSTSSNRLIWFQHFHKAGGTSFIEAAHRSGWKFYHPNLNGNPVNESHRFLPIWTWQVDELETWLKIQMANGVNFVCCEWGFSTSLFEVQDVDVRKIAILRDPKARLLSNFYYDVVNGYCDTQDILEYVEGSEPYHKPDYYTRLVTGETGQAAREQATCLLKRYDHIAFLENPKSYTQLLHLIPGVLQRHANRTDTSDKRLCKARSSVVRHEHILDEMVQDERRLIDNLKHNFF